MKQYGCFQAIFMSFYSGKLYRDVARNWGASTFLYLFLLLTLCWAVLMIPIQRDLKQSAVKMVNEMIAEWPKKMTIKDGLITTTENRPYVIKNNKTNKTWAVIDTSGKYTRLEETDALMLITKDTVMYWNGAPQSEEVQAIIKKHGNQQDTAIVISNNNKGRVTIEKIPNHLNFAIDPVQMKEAFVKIASWLWILLLPFLILFSFFYRFLQSGLYAVFGKLFAALTGIQIAYVDVVKLAMVALTPAIIISTVFEWYGKWFYHLWLFFLVSIAYLLFAVHANRQGQQ